jgi:diguanylate cyclase (GGDEF)-like protein
VTAPSNRHEVTALADRMGHLLLLRIAIGAVVVMWALLRPEALGIGFAELAGLTGAYLAVAAAGEVARRRSARFGYWILTALLLLDGVYLAAAMYVTGGTQSPIRFLVYLDLVAVSLLASYRTGLKIALWHSLLFFVVLYAQAALFIPAVDVIPGVAITFDQMPVLNVTAFWLFALATCLFSALNERELRLRRGDLEAIVDVGTTLDDVRDPVLQSRIVLDGVMDRFGFRRGVILGASDDRVVVLAARGTTSVPTTASPPDSIVRRTWERREILAVRELDAERNPLLAAILPGARGLLVAPMVADGQPAGAIIIESGEGRLLGVERRVLSMLGQFASLAALNVRNAVLLKHVQDLAERDSLTGAANRRMFQQTLERILAASPANPGDGRVTAVLFIDLDDFKVVNDTLGHAAGDELLVAVTDRISGLVRGSDLVARLGGDEFAVLTEDEPMLGRSRAMAERLVNALRAPYHLGGRDVIVSASIGIASATDAPGNAQDLVRNADVAMYLAKANGKSGFALFDPEMHETIRERHELSAELQQAVDRDQLRLVYQPIVGLEHGELAGVEALLRWQHPVRGLVMPGRFIEIAEETGSILPIGRWVLREACRDAGRWLAAGMVPTSMFLGVNVSAREVQQPGFVEGVASTLEETGLRPENLVLEITETALLRATPATIATLGELRALGVRTVIDDFGTGYFSLSHLRQFPVDVLKIASEFVQDDDPASRSSALAGAVVALGRSLQIETVAEGIETAAQAERMRDLGCAYGQGYYFARPMPEEALLAGASASAGGTTWVPAADGDDVEAIAHGAAPAPVGASLDDGAVSVPGPHDGRPRRRVRQVIAQPSYT